MDQADPRRSMELGTHGVQEVRVMEQPSHAPHRLAFCDEQHRLATGAHARIGVGSNEVMQERCLRGNLVCYRRTSSPHHPWVHNFCQPA
jgi:hypothetical protein